MNDVVIKKIIVLVRKWVQSRVAEINHAAVIKDIYSEVAVTAGYFVTLTLANLIALSGLINNSAPVIIGAMLISPLMGPILSFGFAFITGEEVVLQKAVRKITMSVVLTIVVAALASVVSPLQEITSEIASRTKPNIYDLAIAFLSGTAGAVAICTKKNYLTIVPGVAIATAVIPPLSVTGFGFGIGSLSIAFGGFLLFFTNFVAIIIATCAVFYFYGFKPSMITEADVAYLKKRVILLAVVLFIISIPLIYTLHKSISEIGTHKQISVLLKQELDREKESKLQTFSYIEKDDVLEISAVVNTVEYIKDPDIEDIERDISAALETVVKLNLDQIKVQPRGLKEQVVVTIAPPKPPWEVLKTSREEVVKVVKQTIGRVEKLISPSPVTDFQTGFNDKSLAVSIDLIIKRDEALSDDQILLLKRLIADELGLPVKLSVENRPFVEPLVFKPGEIAISAEMKTALSAVRDVFNKDNQIAILIESYPESKGSYKKRTSLAEDRAWAVSSILINEYGIPDAVITAIVNKRKVDNNALVRVSISTGQGR
ncbi:MAG: TIGR00341 family protein [Nitrospiraceae bacterium]|nr:MAG: TIGR00341 family protein [Nitrospiraceae bacterium]